MIFTSHGPRRVFFAYTNRMLYKDLKKVYELCYTVSPTFIDALLFFLLNDFSAPSGSPLAHDTAFSQVVSAAIFVDLDLTKLGWKLDMSETGAMALICDKDSGVSVISNAEISDSI